ncbi:MAG: DUF2207 domain-containing protein, partial [Chloroflexi bacterium]|nr:DUF2207 domain-containing protein [Chloroflexota bacterium]
MWRKVLFSLLIVGLFVTNAAAQEKSYSADRFDVDVVVEEGGALFVTETVTFNFVGEPFTFVFRELPTDHTDGITDIVAMIDGRISPHGTEPGQVEITGNDTVRVEWHFEPTVDSTRTFTLSYRLLGVVRQNEGADLLLYQPLPDEYEYTIDSSTVTFVVPETAVFTQSPSITAGTAQMASDGNRISFTKQNVSPNEPLVVSLPFAAGSLITSAPQWQQQAANQQAVAPIWIGIAIFVAVVGVFAVGIAYRRVQPQTLSKKKSPLFEPPTDLPPAIAGVLNGNGAEPAWSNALATLFDLADRGVFQIDELPDKKWYQQHDFMIRQVSDPSKLHLHEQGLLDAMFETKKGRVTKVKMSKLGSQLSSSQWKLYSEALKEELKSLGFIDKQRKQARTTFVVAGALLMVFALAVLILVLIMQDTFGVMPLIIAGSLFLVGIVSMIMGASVSPLTDEAAVSAAEWQRFANHLKDVTKGKTAVSSPDMFVRFLPYAASYGLLHQWAKWFDKNGWTEL